MSGLEKKLPVKRFRLGRVNIAVWENEIEVNGRKVKASSVTLGVRYKDKDGNWSNSNAFRLNDLPKAIMGLSKTYWYLLVGVQCLFCFLCRCWQCFPLVCHSILSCFYCLWGLHWVASALTFSVLLTYRILSSACIHCISGRHQLLLAILQDVGLQHLR